MIENPPSLPIHIFPSSLFKQLSSINASFLHVVLHCSLLPSDLPLLFKFQFHKLSNLHHFNMTIQSYCVPLSIHPFCNLQITLFLSFIHHIYSQSFIHCDTVNQDSLLSTSVTLPPCLSHFLISLELMCVTNNKVLVVLWYSSSIVTIFFYTSCYPYEQFLWP